MPSKPEQTVNSKGAYMESAQCGNPRHPKGAWHTATPLPMSNNLVERFKQWRNRRRWGCNCYD